MGAAASVDMLDLHSVPLDELYARDVRRKGGVRGSGVIAENYRFATIAIWKR